MILLKNKNGDIKEFNDISEIGMGFADWINITDINEGKIYLLQKAKNENLAKLEAYILARKTEPFTSHLAPEIIDGARIGPDVKFYWYVDSIPNSNLTPESVLNQCTMRC
jgi:hypothetical protein